MVGEILFSSFISKIISDCLDVSKNNIKKLVENENTKYRSSETEIYSIIINVLNKVTENEYKDTQEKIYDVAEKLLNEFKNARYESARLDGLCDIFVCIDNKKYTQFLKTFYQELSKEPYRELYRELMLLQHQEESNKASHIKEKVEQVVQKLDDITSVNKESLLVQNNNGKYSCNKKEDYIKGWNSRLFLHKDNDTNPLTLKDVFIMPSCDVFELNKRYDHFLKLDDEIDFFVNYNRTLAILITGVPGIGKTTIVSWIAQKYSMYKNLLILRFRDWEIEDLENGLLKAICSTLVCKKTDLNDKILVLDGFDEIKCLEQRKYILDEFFNDLNDLEKIKIIITSRSSYIDEKNFDRLIEIKPFYKGQIREFYQQIVGEQLNDKIVFSNNIEILGIPVILYMAIMSNIDITQNATKSELYNRIFAEKGGIFDKFSYQNDGYDKGAQIFRNNENTKKYLKFLQEIAFMMYEKNDFKLKKSDCNIPQLNFNKKLISILEFPIKHLFESTESNIEFIHNSIYEYFVSEYIFGIIKESIDLNSSKQGMACTFGELFKSNKLSKEILQFLQYRIRNSNLKDKFDEIFDTFQLMTEDGMMYYTQKCYKNIVKCETNVIYNMLELLHLWENKTLNFNLSFFNYISYIRSFRINLTNANLEEKDLSNMDLSNVDLSNALLVGAKLNGTNLTNCNLINSNLIRAKLIDANLTKADLTGADLVSADLRRANLTKANLTGADLRGENLEKTDIRETNFRKANLSRAKLEKVDLRQAFLDETNLEFTIYSNCFSSRTIF